MDVLLKLKTWYSIHKWTSIFTGIALLMWFITGIVMTAPGLVGTVFAMPGPAESPPPDFYEVEMSPAQALEQLETLLGQPVAAQSVHVRQIGDQLAYQVILAHGGSHLIDAQTGQEIVITAELAEQLVRQSYPYLGNVVSVEYLARADLGNVFQTEPVYRVVFDDGWATYAHVSANTGAIGLNDRKNRFWQLFQYFHTFEVLKVVAHSREQVVTALVWVSSILTLFAALNGYYLALPRRWQLKRRHR